MYSIIKFNRINLVIGNLKIRSKKALYFLIIFFIFSLDIQYLHAQPMNFTLDFEEGNLRGWTKTGNAFDHQPTLGDNPTARNRGQPSNHQGRYWIGTYEKYQEKDRQKPGDIQGDRPQGILTSAPFTIPQGKLSFLIGGGSTFQTRIELLVQDPIEGGIRVFQASGRDTETMHRVEWNLTSYAGKTGRIRIVDASSVGWGHINADDFRFTAVQGVTTPVIPAFPLEQKVEVPDLVRRNISEAESILNRVKLRLGEITKKPSNQKPGTILRQSPAAHSKVERGTPVHIWVAERELVEVPNLVRHHIDETESILREFRLQLGDITKRASDNKEGTILLQEPSAGTRVPVGSPVNLWISSKREKPVAKINPAHLRVIQGEKAVFESQSTPEGGIKENWTGPRGQKATGNSFKVYTDQLNPDSYVIMLEVIDRWGKTDKATATLEVIPTPIVKYNVTIQAAPTSIEEGKSVRFRAAINPIVQGVQYRFNFGDGSWSNWTRELEAMHVYPSSGIYHAFVIVRKEETIIAESSTVQIEVTPTEVIPTGYQMFLKTEPNRTEPNQPIVFSASLEPSIEGAEYRFIFGDGRQRDWSNQNVVEHSYSEPGDYRAYVIARLDQEIISESTPVTINIITHLPQQTPTPTKVGWIIVGLLIGLAVGYYLFSRIKRPKISKHLESSIHIRSYKDIGTQQIESETPVLSGFEICLRPVLDKGKQDIEANGSLIDERREHG
jgi:hypothetical protein